MWMLVQPFGLESQGGGAKILRSLVQGRRGAFLSVATGPAPPPPTDLGEEVHLPARWGLGRIDSSRLAPWGDWASRAACRAGFRQRLRELVVARRPTMIHAIAHAPCFRDAFLVAREAGLPFTLTVHDELSYNMRRHPGLRRIEAGLGRAWRDAERRIVICEPMGEAYRRRFGDRPYEVITDGLDAVPDRPRPPQPKQRRIYFMGSLHLSYHRNFTVLSRAARQVQADRPDLAVSLLCRGSGFAAPGDGLACRVLPWGEQAQVERDLEEADLLYLPVPFEPEYEPFARYSLSTKLVTYLGSGLPILYHGPAYSAAADLLARHDAALPVTDPSPAALTDAIEHATRDRRRERAEAALALARNRFLATDQRRRFWDAYADAPLPAPARPQSKAVLSSVC